MAKKSKTYTSLSDLKDLKDKLIEAEKVKK
jgi:hypothetical protein